MAAVAAVVGLVAGIVLGFSSSGPGTAAQAGTVANTSALPTTTTLPAEFHTVILGSFDDLANADSAMRRLRGQGVDDAALLKQADYSSLRTRYAVYSGRFENREAAEEHEAELAQLGITNSYYRFVTR
jgi:cell division septation protein DedD